jgi:alkaline phosphatase
VTHQSAPSHNTEPSSRVGVIPRVRVFGLLLLAALAGCEASPSGPPEPPPAVVLIIGDGMGDGAVEAARLAGVDLAGAMGSLPVTARVTTSSASDSITDSAAAATAYASGVATYNGAIGVDVDGVPVETVLEAAESLGWATGLVATSSVTHATPAAFAAHVPDRGDELAIAQQMARSGVDVLLGGGRQYFESDSRPDGLDLVGELRSRGCTVWLDAAEIGAPDRDCVAGFLAAGALPRAGQRSLSLAELTRTALAVLTRDPDGFFLMVEGSQIDWAGHANDGPWLVEEMRDFHGAVAEAAAVLSGRTNTTLIVTSDHETGGMTATSDGNGVVYEWTTTGHTAASVPFHGRGAGLAELPDTFPNHRLGRLLLARVRR